MNKFVLIFLIFSFYVCVNIYVSMPPTLMRSEPQVKHIQMEKVNIFKIAFIWLCLTLFILSNIDLNVRYLPFNTSLNTLNVSTKAKNNKNLNLILLFLLFLVIFDYVSVLVLAQEYCSDFDIRYITKKIVVLAKMVYSSFASITLGACYWLTCYGYSIKVCFWQYPFETLAIWLILMHLALCPDIHPNPGPTLSNSFTGGFFSFCNWNLNTLSKEDFYLIIL